MGLDVHEKTVVATVDGQGLKRETRTYDTFTESLMELRNWLKQQEVSHIAMESTGVYWKPIFIMKAQVKKSGRTPEGDKHLKTILTQSAWAATRKNGSYYQAKYRALIGRMGKKKALFRKTK